ncbi:DNA-3-methyladenine glycosylase 2 family protein [Endozoicomonas montiporae]|uniref:DNA-3-methyladenine glycosylase II n=1 Tax=Endozoicomonas montiporae CL-33 TaxID=570277 RepID=A0A142B7P9_9GAMM|nr:AlkA N-terminal domain-containing protein [Endozoicomonas montiporae]AMO54775.1 DNA methylation and regulatory protein Ada [Endozoicomonas montiporae CL-33]
MIDVMNEAVYYRAMQSRDRRFDGKFFVAVKTTGIYCRPICPAKPKQTNVEFYSSSQEAENAGYRPCMRCRPECAPSSAAWLGKSAVVQRALRVISNGEFIYSSEEEFANKFGLTARHLRRLFKEEVGRTPKQCADRARLDFSRKLLTETNLPITEVATTSGFLSIRRFNDAFKKRFQQTPGLFRKNASDKNGIIDFSLAYRPPFDWDEQLNFFRNHAISHLEMVNDHTYERVFRVGESVGHVKVTHQPENLCLNATITMDDNGQLLWVSKKIRKMFDLDSDPLMLTERLAKDPILDSLNRQSPGLRLTGMWDPFEAAITTILGQLVSLKHARLLVNQLVSSYGEKVVHPVDKSDIRLFPTPEILANCDLARLKTTGKRKESIRTLSKLVVSGAINLSPYQCTEVLKQQLLKIPGIGPWTAEYILLRGFNDTDAFPSSDLVIRRALEKHKDIDPEQVRPWRGYMAVHLWNRYASDLSRTKGSDV